MKKVMKSESKQQHETDTTQGQTQGQTRGQSEGTKIVLITGASSDIGLEMARLFAKESVNSSANRHVPNAASERMTIILAARRMDRLNAVAAELLTLNPTLQVVPIEIDLGLPGAGQELYEKTQRLGLQVNILVNNAGLGLSGEFSKLPLAKALQMMDLNMRSLVELTHLFLPTMIQRKFGHILNIGSTAGFQPGPYMSVYYASKAFVNSFSEALHVELKGTGVTCTVLAPGATATEFAQAAGSSIATI